jgi:hypothetical protein
MKQIILLVVVTSALWLGWAWAREQEMLNHSADVHMQEMQSAPCPPSSNPSGGG